MKTKKFGIHIILIVGIVTGLLTHGGADVTLGAPAATLEVATTAIANDANDSQCDLWEALQAISQAVGGGAPTYHECTASASANIITFVGAASGGTITLPLSPNPNTDLPFVRGDTTLMGPVTLSGGGPTGDTHILRLAPGATLTLNAVTIRDGHTSGHGAAIYDDGHGTINLIGVSLIGNVADGSGGAIESNGTLNIVGTNFSGNTAGNASGNGWGGAIHFSGYGALRISTSNFAGNIAAKGGGALAINLTGDSATAEISDTDFSGNIATGGGDNDGGGALYNQSPNSDARLNIVRTAFSGNLSPGGSGGALYITLQATTAITDTSFNANLAGSASDARYGGAIYSQSRNLRIGRVAFIANSAVMGNGGALAVDRSGAATVFNTTFTGNTAPAGQGGAAVITNTQQGGPVTTLVAKNVTFSGNSAQGSNNGDSLFVASGHSASLGNTILDGSHNCAGTVTSLGHNLDSGDTCGFNPGAGNGDLTNANADLDTPFFNGGPISSLLTQKLNPGSDALDAGDPAICEAAPVNNEDQRSEPRPQDGDGNGSFTCDMGAFENATAKPGYGSNPVQPGPVHVGNAIFGTTVTTTFAVFNTGDAALLVSLAAPALSGPDAAEFGVVTTFPLDIGAGDPAEPVAVSCSPVGPTVGQRTATLTFLTNDTANATVSYTLTCNAAAVPVPGFGSTPAAPGPVDFGSVISGTQRVISFTVQEIGSADLSVSNPAIGGANPAEFTLVTVFPFTIADGGADREVQLTCTPATFGLRTATLTVNTNDPNHAAVTFNLICEGVLPPSPILETPGQSISNNLADGNNGPYGVAVSPDGKNVYVTDYGDDLLTVYSRNESGQLVLQERYFNNAGSIAGMDGPRLVTVSPDGNNVYVAGSLGDSIVSFSRDAGSGSLSFLKKVTRGDNYGFCMPDCMSLGALDGSYQIVISPDEQYGYASSVNDDSITVFARNQATGALALDPLMGPVQVYSDTARLDSVYGIAISPDGAHLYAAGYASDNLVQFDRDATTGRLTYVDSWGIADAPSLNGAFRVTISPDGAYVYTASYDGDSVTAFSRNPATGALTYLAGYQDGVGDIDGLNAATSVAVSHDGRYLFATGYTDKAVVAFARDQATGLLTFRQMVQRDPFTGANPAPALDGARDVAVSPDGRMIFVTAYLDNRVVALALANPRPALISLLPGSAIAGSGAITLTLTGQNFVPGAGAFWISGATTALSTTFISDVALQAVAPGGLLAAAGVAGVQVRNPAPGGGSSNTLDFTITAPGDNPVPSIESLNPPSLAAGSPAFTLTVAGANFIATSEVQWNGVTRTTTLVDANTLQAAIPASDVAQPGSAGVTVFNPAPGGGISNVAAFNVAGPGENPIPSITALTPDSAYSHGAASTDIVLIVTGAGFVEDSTVRWNGADRPTAFVSSTQLEATITGGDLAVPGVAAVTVFSPEPGGGASNTEPFTIRRLYAVFLPLVLRN